jgi:F-type H+-transporting ATPase subunit b
MLKPRARHRALLLALPAAIVLACTASALGQENAGEEASPVTSGNLYNALWAVGTFAVLLVVLGKFAWKPVMRAMEAREQHVADLIAKAQAQQQESQRLLEDYQRRLEQVDHEAAKRMEEARRNAEKARAEIMAAARAEAEKAIRQATADIDAARRQALEDLYRYAAELATDAAGKIMRKELNPQDQRRLVAESLELIRQRAGSVAG